MQQNYRQELLSKKDSFLRLSFLLLSIDILDRILYQEKTTFFSFSFAFLDFAFLLSLLFLDHFYPFYFFLD